jgi:excisionase family DNA binding protein
MKLRPTQFAVCENTASSRQHASRLSVDSDSNDISVEVTDPAPQRRSPQSGLSASVFQNSMQAAPQHAATGGEERDAGHLLTVHEVAKLLRVPMSWVYGRLRKRSTEQLPAYRVGKYWRFQEEEIIAWVKRQRRSSHVA